MRTSVIAALALITLTTTARAEQARAITSFERENQSLTLLLQLGQTKVSEDAIICEVQAGSYGEQLGRAKVGWREVGCKRGTTWTVFTVEGPPELLRHQVVALVRDAKNRQIAVSYTLLHNRRRMLEWQWSRSFVSIPRFCYSERSMAKNYYDILGVDKKATKDDIKKAFRKLAQQHHPDKGGNEDTFKAITEAYSVLGDDKKRREYDSYGQTFPGGGQGAAGFDWSQFGGMGGNQYAEFDFSDIFEGFGDIFGARQGRVKRGRDISIDVEISFKEAAFGVKRSVLLSKVSACDTCTGTGAKPGTSVEICKACNGAGKVHETRNSVLGAFTSVRACAACEGTGQVPKEKCATCAGRGVTRKEQEIKIEIPAGIENGEMIRMPGQGEAVKGGSAGDLYVKVHVKTHPVFKKEGPHLLMNLPVKLTDALLGTTVSIETLDDKVIEVKVPPMDKTEETLRIRGKGLSLEGVQGDLLIKVTTTLPRKLSSKAKKAIEELKSEGL